MLEKALYHDFNWISLDRMPPQMYSRLGLFGCVWPDKATADAAEKKMQEDDRMKPPADAPFDPKRMIFGGFGPIFEMGR